MIHRHTILKIFRRNFAHSHNKLQDVTKNIYYSRSIKLGTTTNYYYKKKMISIEKANELMEKNINVTKKEHAVVIYDLSKKNLIYSYLSSKAYLKTEENTLISNYQIDDQQWMNYPILAPKEDFNKFTVVSHSQKHLPNFVKKNIFSKDLKNGYVKKILLNFGKVIDDANKVILSCVEDNRIIMKELQTKVFLSSNLGLISPEESKFFFWSINFTEDKNKQILQIIKDNQIKFKNFEYKIKAAIDCQELNNFDNLNNLLSLGYEEVITGSGIV